MLKKTKAQCQPEPENDEYMDTAKEIKEAMYLARLKIRLAAATVENFQQFIGQLTALLEEKPDTSGRDIIEIVKAISTAANIPLGHISTYVRTLYDQQSLDAADPADTGTIEEFFATSLGDSEDDLITDFQAEMRAFYDWIDTNPLPADAQALWHVLMHFNEKCSEMKEFTLANTDLSSILGISRQHLDRMRNVLVQNSRISYRKRPGRQAGYYTMLPFVSHDVF